MLPTELFHFVNSDDVGVLQIGCNLCLGMKALHFSFSGKLSRQDHLDRHQPIQADLPSLVNDPMPPREISAMSS